MSSSSQARRLQHPFNHHHHHHHHHHNHNYHPHQLSTTSTSSGYSPYTPYTPAHTRAPVFPSRLIPRDYLRHGRSDAQASLAPAEASHQPPPVRRPRLQVHPPSAPSSTPPTRAPTVRPSVENLHSFARPRFHHPRQPTPFHPPPSPTAVPAPSSPYVAYSPYSFSSSTSPTQVHTVPAASPTVVSPGDHSPNSAESVSLSVSVSDRASPPSSSSSLSPPPNASYTAYKPAQTPAVQPVQPVQSRAAAASAMPSQSRSQNPSREQLRKENSHDTSTLNGNAGHTNGNPSVSTSAVAAAANPSIAAAMAEGSRRNVPRTSSIDSAISSISSGSRSQKTLDTSTITPADIANLISKAGSAEAVIIHLLKEKQHAANQNAQLWKLVDKQRTMVFALNKDLERAMKDKQRYKMKLKEVQESAVNAQKSEDGQSPATTLSKRSDDSPQIPQPKTALDSLDRSSPVDPTLSRDADSATSTPSSILRAEQMLLDQERPDSNLSNRTGPSPTTKMSPPLRRPPPAPLKIDEAQRVRPDIEVTSGTCDSDYEDMEVDEVPEMDRGRRKTREEDDQQRAQILAQEQAARSRSNKKKAKGIEPPLSVQQGQAHGFPGMGLPTSPRAILTGQQPPFSARPSSPPEPKSYLTPVNNEMHSTQMSMPLRSPGLYAGLPNSPRPGDRPPNSPMPRMPFNRRASLATPPMSPRSTFPTPAPAPRSPLPPPPAQSQKKANLPSIDASVRIDSPTFPQHGGQIYRGLVSDQYPDLLLPPDALPSIDVKVSSSRLRPSRNSYLALKPQEEDPVFTLSVISRATRSELWRVEKVTVALPQLDQQIRQTSKLPFKLPDRSIFSGHSPAKIDSRRAALNSYFTALLDMPLGEAASLVVCQFLTADAIDPRDDETSLLGNSKTPIPLGPDGKPRMEGYLTKRGKNFGGWKSRYFVLHGPELKYYESPGGPHMGTIKIRHAQIGKQSPSQKNQSPVRGGGGDDDASDNQYRHAFLILEPKKKDSNALVRHVLCAECDDERDAWVEALLSYVEEEEEIQGQKKVKESKEKEKEKEKMKSSKKGSRDIPENDDTLRALSYEDVVAQEAPVRGGTPSGAKGLTKSNSLHDSSPSQAQANATFDQIVPMSPTHRNISGPTNGVKIQDAGAWGNKNPSTVKQKKLSIWGFRGNPAADIGRNDSISSSSERKDPVRPVFGLPLVEAVEFCGPRGVEEDTGLPAVVYRCIEYLKAQHAEAEEGIFRLSGSNVIIKGLKERFNVEGDLDFLEGDTYYDVHAVASLFKQYLRELPVTVLTRELHLEFLHVLDLKEKEHRIAAFHLLVHKLPKPNLTLLRVLSQFLLVIVNNSDINKMTVRNVGIVFAPTLNIPAPVFSMFLTEYDLIFCDDPPAWLVERIDEVNSMPPPQSQSQSNSHSQLHPGSHGTDEIRSPRHQMFTDLPTTPNPAYTSFPIRSSSTNGRLDNEDPVPADAATPRREHFDTGFVPMYEQTAHQPAFAEYASMSGMLAPNGAGQPTSKSKRRESSLLFMGLGGGGKKGSLPQIRDEGN